jgi:hypothetical protein
MAGSGTGVGLIHQVLPAGEIVQKVRQQAVEVLDQRAAEYVLWYKGE